MYPTFASPAAALTIAAMMNDEAIASAQRRSLARQVREARRARSRADARRRTRVTRSSLRAVFTAISVATLLSVGVVSHASPGSGQVEARRIPLQQLHDPGRYTVDQAQELVRRQYP